MFDGISQALLDDSVEAGSDFIGSFVGKPRSTKSTVIFSRRAKSSQRA